MKGLMGDSSDNIPGVPGIGEKTAIALLKEFTSLENLLANIDKVSGQKTQGKSVEYSEQARLSKQLGTIVVDVPLDIDFDQCRWRRRIRNNWFPFQKTGIQEPPGTDC